MKYFILATVVMLASFQVVALFDSPTARTEAEKYFTKDQIKNGSDYARARRLIFWPATWMNFAVLLVLAGNARRIADVCSWLAGDRWLLTVLLVGVVCALAQEAIDFPAAAAQQAQLQAWGLSHRSWLDWLLEEGKAFAVFGTIEAIVLLGMYLLMRWLPGTWWLACSLAAPMLAITLTYLHPIFFAPLFNKFEPLHKSQYKDLEPVVKDVLKKADIAVGDVLVMDGSRQSGHTNAYFTGWGSSQRIVLFDTLLKKHTPAEIETILAHEIGHWKHNDIVKGIALGAVASFCGFFLLFCFLKFIEGRPPWLLRNAADPAGLPLILLCAALASWLCMPAMNTYSRSIERQADAYSLELARQPEAFIAAEKRLAIDNISNVAPHPLAVFLFNSHPTAVERIEMAEKSPK